MALAMTGAGPSWKPWAYFGEAVGVDRKRTRLVGPPLVLAFKRRVIPTCIPSSR